MLSYSKIVCLIMLKWLLQVRLTLEEPEPGTTVVSLTQTDVPEEDRLIFLLVIIFLICLSFLTLLIFIFCLCLVLQIWKFNCGGEH